jgi:peptidyl-prolyl cis-trans isomerase A (cyclophilin A)
MAVTVMSSFRALPVIGLLVCALAALGQVSPAAKPPAKLGPGTYAYIQTSMGQIVCQLLPAEAPKTVANFVGLATGTKAWIDPKTGKERRTPFYNGLTFHRIVKDFMIQGGDPLATGEGGPGFALDDEISANLHFDKPGMLAMAKRSFPNSAGSQFFITTAAAPWLEAKYSIFGQVVEGQDVADKISQLPTDGDDKPQTTVRIEKIAIRKVGTRATTPAARPPVKQPVRPPQKALPH